jgi:hypothetical protein
MIVTPNISKGMARLWGTVNIRQTITQVIMPAILVFVTSHSIMVFNGVIFANVFWTFFQKSVLPLVYHPSTHPIIKPGLITTRENEATKPDTKGTAEFKRLATFFFAIVVMEPYHTISSGRCTVRYYG